jgi:hypothetical protein
VPCYAVYRLVELNQEGCASEDITAQVEKLTKEVVSGHRLLLLLLLLPVLVWAEGSVWGGGGGTCWPPAQQPGNPDMPGARLLLILLGLHCCC